jgi:Domain of unknown function (DUF4383)
MSHLPVDHPLRGFYRGLALLTGVGLIAFGIAGWIQTSSLSFFDQTGKTVLYLSTNPAFSVLSLVVGIGVLVATVAGRNLDVAANTALGAVFLLAGLVMLCVIRTDANYLASSVRNVNVSFVVGMLLISHGLYGRVSRHRPRATA